MGKKTKRFIIPWMAWYGDMEAEFAVPNDWELVIANMADGEDIGEEGIVKAFDNPISSARLRELARSRGKAVIAVDDISRPTQADRLIPLILGELKDAGIQGKSIKILMSTGAHRPMHRVDLIKKLGENVYYEMDVYNHHPFENLLDLGVSSRGTPIHINRFFMEADIKVGVGCIMPHPYAGFSGGAKIVLPGLSGIDTLEKNHLPAVTGLTSGLNMVEGNENREDIEEIGRKVGLDMAVNVVVNSRRSIAGCFVGDPVGAHRAGVEFARNIYRTTIPEAKFDVAIINAYPKDTDLIQASNAFNIFLSSKKDIVKKAGAIVLISASPEGAGFHSLQGVGMRLFEKIDTTPFLGELFKEKQLYIFSPNLSKGDVAQYFNVEFECENVILFRAWDSLLNELKNKFRECKAIVFPNSSIQLADS